jgi:hypothetical protein
VVALAYITAFAPDKGESVNTLIADPPPGAPVPSFAGDLPESRAAFLADAQVPWGLRVAAGTGRRPRQAGRGRAVTF